MRTIVLNNIQGDVTVTFNGVKVPVVFAVSSNGALIDVANADESCIAVALVVGEHKFWIEKNGESNTTSIKAAYTAAVRIAYGNDLPGGFHPEGKFYDPSGKEGTIHDKLHTDTVISKNDIRDR